MAKKIKKYKVGLDSETMAISLVTEPAIEVDFIHMSKDEEEKQQVFLEANEKHMVYGAVYLRISAHSLRPDILHIQNKCHSMTDNIWFYFFV